LIRTANKAVVRPTVNDGVVSATTGALKATLFLMSEIRLLE